MDAANPIDDWIGALDEAQVDARLNEIDETVERLEAERALLRQALDLKRQWATRHFGSDGDDNIDTTLPMRPVPEAHKGLGGAAPLGKSEAALRVLGSNPQREWAAKEVAAELLRLGWMQDTPKDNDSLASTLSRLAKDRRVHRPRRGVYRLAEQKGESQPG